MNDQEQPPSQGTEATDDEAAKQADNPGVDEIAGERDENDEGGLGDRTGASGGAQPTQPDDEQNKGQLRK